MESKGIKKVLKLTMIDGRELVCTPDHKIKIFKDIYLKIIQI
jgi:intein/homing endonuclease